jgi:hypothetical protein
MRILYAIGTQASSHTSLEMSEQSGRLASHGDRAEQNPARSPECPTSGVMSTLVSG